MGKANPGEAVRRSVSKARTQKKISGQSQYQQPAAFQGGQISAQVRTETVDETCEGQRLDNYLLAQLKGVPKTHVYRIIRSGEVRINGKRAEAAYRLAVGDAVRIPPVRLSPPKALLAPARTFAVLYEDEGLVVVNKPAGVAVHGGSGVSFGVIEQMRQARPQCKMLELVHRLDRETSGALMIAKKRSVLTALQDQLRGRETGKTYLALVKGVWPEQAPHAQVIDVPLHKYLTPDGERRVRVTTGDDPQGKRSLSVVRVVRRFAAFTLLNVTIKTGRTHQIRVHLAHAGFPIAGDDKYGDFALNRELRKTHRFDRMFLHAYQISIVNPQTGEALALQAALPGECLDLLEILQMQQGEARPHD